VLVVAVAFLFFKINSLSPAGPAVQADESTATKTAEPAKAVAVSTTPTGKIAFVNIDELNDKSLEIGALADDAKRRKTALENGLENLNIQYEKKMQEYQVSAKAGLASPSELQMKEKEILALEKEAQNKQLQMENLSMKISQENAAFQKN